MAEEDQELEGNEEEGTGSKKKPNLLLIGLIAQLVVIFGCLGVVVKVVLFAPKTDLSAERVQDRVISAIRDAEEEIRLLKIDQITVNLVDDHTVRAQIVLELSDTQVQQILEERMPAVRARLLKVLSLQKFEDLDRIQGKLELKDKLAEVLNEELKEAKYKGSGMIREVYFVDMMLI